MKTFKYKKYKNCYFIVDSYLGDKKAMAITIENNDGAVAICTVYDKFGVYEEGLVTIKNYSENSHMTDFLKNLGIVLDIVSRYPCNTFSYESLNTNNPQTIDICIIDINKLKEYCKSWNYNV